MQLFGEPKTTVAYKVTRTLIGVECDVCGKVITSTNRSMGNNIGRYFEVLTGHHDWGLESPESRKKIDVCPDCVGKYIADYLVNCSDTGYLEVSTEVVWGRKKSEVLDRQPEDGEVIRVDHVGPAYW